MRISMIVGLAFFVVVPVLGQETGNDLTVVEWAREHAIPLATPEAGNGFEDLESLRRIVGDARIVSLGEGTHGTREFFQLKHRFLEFLVEELGFRVFAIEASFPDCEAINAYVQDGVGDPEEALHGQGFWTWDTEEVLALIEWMRAKNAEADEPYLRFYGIDMQSSQPALAGALAYVQQHDEELAEALAADLEPLTRRNIFATYAGLEAETKEVLGFGLEALTAFFDDEKETLVEDSSLEAWQLARQHAVVAQQASDLMAGRQVRGGSWRDRCMADNVDWVLEREPAGTRMVLWAHNGHVKEDGPPKGFSMMGHFLARKHGEHHVAFGFGFHHGSFQAIVRPRPAGDTGPMLRTFEVGPPREGSIDAMLGVVDHPIYVLDLRTAPDEGPVAAWLRTRLPWRTVGATFSLENEDPYYRPTFLAEEFDALVFVRRTTAARPNPLTRKRYGLDGR